MVQELFRSGVPGDLGGGEKVGCEVRPPLPNPLPQGERGFKTAVASNSSARGVLSPSPLSPRGRGDEALPINHPKKQKRAGQRPARRQQTTPIKSAQNPRQIQSLLFRTLNGDLITRIGMTHDAGAGVVPQHAGDALVSGFAAVADDDHAGVL
ncbi:hypothetical protein D3C71_1402950 [compost metagenome]